MNMLLFPFFLLTVFNLTKGEPGENNIKCSSVLRKTQKHGEYTPLSEGMGITAFDSLQKGTLATEANKIIPHRCKEATRVALYNMGSSSISKKPTVEKITSDLNNIDATVIVFQDAKNTAELEKRLTFKGYKFILKEGNILIASLLPIKKFDAPNIKVQHLRVRVSLDDYDLDILSIWMVSGESDGRIPSEAIFGKVYLSQAPKNSTTSSSPNIKNQLSLMASSVFSLLNKPEPPFTSNNGLVMDSIGASNGLVNQLCGAYVYHTDSTGRLPLLVDLGKCQMTTPFWIYSIFVVLLVAIIGGYLFFRRHKRPTPSA